MNFFSGESLTWSQSDSTLYIDWSNIFNAADLVYQVYIGSMEGASDFIVGLETNDTKLSFTSNKIDAISEVHCVIIGISKAGIDSTFRETLFF